MFGHMAWKTNLVTMTNDIYPTRVVGALSGIVGLGSGFGGMLFTFAAGRIIDSVSYGVLFVIMGFLHPAALLIVLWFVRQPATDLMTAAPVARGPRGTALSKAS
jgi:ACS family hexuronate transporter-like MFS transporter